MIHEFWSWILCQRLALNPIGISKVHCEIQIRTGCPGEQREKHLSIIFCCPLVKGIPTVCSLLVLPDQTCGCQAGNQRSSGARSARCMVRLRRRAVGLCLSKAEAGHCGIRPTKVAGVGGGCPCTHLCPRGGTLHEKKHL